MRSSAQSATHIPTAPGHSAGNLPEQRSPAAHFAAMNSLSMYWQFYWSVAGAQLSRWLPSTPGRILDLSGPAHRGAPRAAAAGHDVVRLFGEGGPNRERPELHLVDSHTGPEVAQGRVASVRCDGTFLPGLADSAFDGVVADNRGLSEHLVTEALLTEIARVLRPGGRALVCVDSVVLGMALLAEQDCWPELSHAPSADVLLVPWPDGTITRCFTVEQLTELLDGAGLELEWSRPRTVLSASAVETILDQDRTALPRLVEMELQAAETGDHVGVHLLASAVKPR